MKKVLSLIISLLVFGVGLIEAHEGNYYGPHGMMSGFYGTGMWGFGFGWIVMILIIVALVLLITWLIQLQKNPSQRNKK